MEYSLLNHGQDELILDMMHEVEQFNLLIIITIKDINITSTSIDADELYIDVHFEIKTVLDKISISNVDKLKTLFNHA